MRRALPGAAARRVLTETELEIRREPPAAVLTILVPLDPRRRPIVVGSARPDILIAGAAALLFGAHASEDLSHLKPADGRSDPDEWVAYARRALSRIVGKLL